MIKNFKNLEYLKSGDSRQKVAFYEIEKLGIFQKLEKYNPVLAGTIPIDIDVPESDLDVICACNNHSGFSKTLIKYFETENDFKIYSTKINGIKSTVAEFKTEHFTFEIFGQNIPTEKQYAYRHMILENKILEREGIEFKKEIRRLKSKGIKTEHAFAKLLALKGNPYEELLKLELTL